MNRVMQECKEGTSIPILSQRGFPEKAASKLRNLIIGDLSSSNVLTVTDNSHTSITRTVSFYYMPGTDDRSFKECSQPKVSLQEGLQGSKYPDFTLPSFSSAVPHGQMPLKACRKRTAQRRGRENLEGQMEDICMRYQICLLRYHFW